MKTNSNSLDTFVRRTQKLIRELRSLMKRYPEEQLEPDQRIFNRLLTYDWRVLTTFIGPIEWRYLRVVEWIEDLGNYDSELREFCKGELRAPTKLDELPMNPGLPLSGPRCLRQLELQLKVLTRWKDDATNSPTQSRNAKIRRDLQTLVEERGLKTVAAEIPVSIDTLRDYLAERTEPQDKTMDRIKSYLKQRKPTD